MLGVSEPHEGPVEVVQLQDAGEQEEARDQDTGEELGHAELLQAQVPQPGRGSGLGVSMAARPPWRHPALPPTALPQTHCSSVRPVRLRQ